MAAIAIAAAWTMAHCATLLFRPFIRNKHTHTHGSRVVVSAAV